MLDQEYQQLAANAVSHAAQVAAESVRMACAAYDRPSAVYRPTLSIDGNQWCALYGANLQDGVAGFGDSPDAAMYAFDKAWSAKLTTGKA